MPKILKLSPAEAQKIAAGEVVERPANVVKELLENSLDSKATQVYVYIEDGGKQLIRVIDNGCGMSSEDSMLAFEQHATSKITSVDDLQSLSTFGFRGEALASIAAVSQVSIITKETSAQQATKHELESGTIKSTSYVSANTGTDIAIHNLFFNVPARKKFLKSTETEVRHIQQLIQALALDHLNVHFKLIVENKLILQCPATTTLEQRVMQLWDNSFTANMLALETKDEKNKLSMHGLISNHNFMRYDRNLIYFFVNKRWVKNQKLTNAFLKGYMNVLPPGRFPAGFIFIDVPSHEVDINIHPRKEEVQFLHPRIVETVLQKIVKETLEKKVIESLQSAKINENNPAPHSSYEKLNQSMPVMMTTLSTAPYVDRPSMLPATQTTKDSMTHSMPAFVVPSIKEQTSVQSEQQENFIINYPTESFSIIGQLNKTYIMIEQEDGLLMVDQHAAHERILYELFAARFEEIATVKLLFAQYITLSGDAIALLEPFLPIFSMYGIDISLFGTTQLIIQAMPVHLKNQSLEDFIKDIMVWISENKTIQSEDFSKGLHEKVRAQMACKAAVKAGDVLSITQMEQLIKDLHTTKNLLTCPHGRPTTWFISSYEIEKKFKRKL